MRDDPGSWDGEGSQLRDEVAEVATAFVEAINHSRSTSGTQKRSLKISLAHLVAEIKSIQVIHALARRKPLQRSLKDIAQSLDELLCGANLKDRYQRLLEEDVKQRASPLSFFSSFFVTRSQGAFPPAIQWDYSPYPRLGMFRELVRRSDVRKIDIEDFIGRDEHLLSKLIALVKGWNSLVDQLYDDSSFDEELEGSDTAYPKPPVIESIFERDDNVRQLSQSLYNSLHANWPCQSEDHNHSGRLGLCVEAKFFLDPQWSSPDQSNESLFMLLTGPDILQECRVCVDDYGVEQDGPACLIMHNDQSRSVCLYLTADDQHQLWDKQRLAQPLEVILAGENYIELSLNELQSIIKPTYAAKRVMGVTLARCILHLFEGPWLSGGMSIDDIYVYCKVQNNQPYPLFDKVFIATKFGPNDDQGSRPGGYKIHPFPTILALGIILLEIELGEDISDIKNDPSYVSKRRKPYYAAQHLLKELRKRFNLDSGLVSAVTFCIDRTSLAQFDTLNSEALLSNQQFVDTYYHKIVRPLEQDLIKGAHWTWEQVEQLQSPSVADAGICKVFTKGAVEISQGSAGVNFVHRTPQYATTMSESGLHLRDKSQLLMKSKRFHASAPMTIAEEPEMWTRQNSQYCGSENAEVTKDGALSYVQSTVSPNLSQHQHARPQTRNDFTVAIICALRIEANAVQAIFEQYWENDDGVYTYGKQANDPNSYTVGLIGNHNVVLAHQPGMGKATAANVAAACSMSFPNIKLALIVGVCGGVPFPGGCTEILLGDVVISKGIVQYDFGRRYPGGQFRRKATVADQPGRPDREISPLLARLETNKHRSNLEDKVAKYLDQQDLNTESCARVLYPGNAEDKLFAAAYIHRHQGNFRSCQICADGACDEAMDSSCDELKCDQQRLISRSRQNIPNKPAVHFGLIASGDTVLKSGIDRDKIANETKVIAFEMEGSGVWDTIPCVIVKGVCDYADSHKNKLWQDYAAKTAAASATMFLRHWSVDTA